MRRIEKLIEALNERRELSLEEMAKVVMVMQENEEEKELQFVWNGRNWVIEGCDYANTLEYLMETELVYPYYYIGDKELRYEHSFKEILDMVWNDPEGFCIKGFERYYGASERSLLDRLQKEVLRQMAFNRDKDNVGNEHSENE